MQEQRTFKYNKYVVAEDFLLISNYNSVMELPYFLRAVINTSSKEYLTEKRQSVNALAASFLLSGQKSTPTRAKKSIAAFKLREGALLGSRTTLRKKELHTILDKLLIFVLPRLFSEKRNNTISEMASLRFLNKSSKTFIPFRAQKNPNTTVNKGVLCSAKQSFSEKETLNIKKSHTQGTILLSQEEKNQLGIHFTIFKEGVLCLCSALLSNCLLSKAEQAKQSTQSKYTTKNELVCSAFAEQRKSMPRLKANLKEKRESSKGPLYHLTLGIKDLLLIPEMQEYSPLFDTVRGLNIGVTLSNPRIKKTFLTEKFTFIKQKFNNQKLALTLLRKVDIFSEEILNNCTLPRKISKGINGDKEKRELFDKKQYREKNNSFNTFCIPKDTSYSKQVRKNFFLTCFQYPSQYN